MFRTLLFIPGNNPSMLQNADVFLTDAVIFDLEDAVSVSEKNNARHLVGNYLINSSVLPKQMVLRVNAVNSSWFNKDLELLKIKKINYLLFPKTDISSLNEAINILEIFEAKHELEETKLICLIESALGVIEVNEIAKNNRVVALLLGGEDLASELEVKRTENSDEIFLARTTLVYASIANKIIPIDTPFTDIDNLEGLEKDAIFAKGLGMKAKACIHPNQLEIINKVFSPNRDEVKWAKKVVEMSEQLPESGAFQFQGKMIDKPIIERAKKIIERAQEFKIL